MPVGQYANRFNVTVMPEGNVKIEFGEATPNGDAHHSAVVLHIGNAKELSELLNNLITQATQGVTPAPAQGDPAVH
ncbi:conserved protein of unknown function [Hyphomicrobium sp. 1Nfss2.1]|uniref:hypothetical protein n=1 Tax=Hyphomicrobium sp. 1Nfss2.1 TaxID=3413936 RepID=UPI003C7E7295